MRTHGPWHWSLDGPWRALPTVHGDVHGLLNDEDAGAFRPERDEVQDELRRFVLRRAQWATHNPLQAMAKAVRTPVRTWCFG